MNLQFRILFTFTQYCILVTVSKGLVCSSLHLYSFDLMEF